METTTKPFGVWLAEELGRRDLTQRQFARAVGVVPVTVGKWVAGKTRPEWSRIPAIATALGLHDQEVIEAFREAEPSPYNDVTLATLLDLPNDLREFEVLLLKHVFRAIRSAEMESEERGRLGLRLH